MSSTKIESIRARQIFDSRGQPTVCCRVTLESGISAEASVPSGASRGSHEAHELRDETDAYGGKGVVRACWSVNNELQTLLRGCDVTAQSEIDRKMIACDGTENKQRLGANAILAVSLACARAAANAVGLPLWRYLGGCREAVLPYPMMNLLNGGSHAANNLDVQEFMIVPTGADTFAGAMRMANEIQTALRAILREDDLSTTIGDEGGFAPDLQSDEAALVYLTRAIEFAGYQPGKDVFLAMDAAASGWRQGSGYRLPKRGINMTRDELCAYFLELCRKYSVISLEDPLNEEDYLGFAGLTANSGNVQIVGDDLFVTKEERLLRGIRDGAANAILIKPNQVGTLTETLRTVETAKKNGYQVIISHRSGETNDSFIADLAVAIGAPYLKAGALTRGERTAKYNRLLEIEDDCEGNCRYGTKEKRSRTAEHRQSEAVHL